MESDRGGVVSDEMTASDRGQEPSYFLDNAASQSIGRFSGLECCYDALTFAHLACPASGVSGPAGTAWRSEQAAAR